MATNAAPAAPLPLIPSLSFSSPPPGRAPGSSRHLEQAPYARLFTLLQSPPTPEGNSYLMRGSTSRCFPVLAKSEIYQGAHYKDWSGSGRNDGTVNTYFTIPLQYVNHVNSASTVTCFALSLLRS
jgi:hypothetical protein